MKKIIFTRAQAKETVSRGLAEVTPRITELENNFHELKPQEEQELKKLYREKQELENLYVTANKRTLKELLKGIFH